MNRTDVVNKAKAYAKNGFTPTISGSACSHFVSRVLAECGSGLGQIDYVPNLVGKCTKTGTPQPGDLVVFDQTYDAVAPAGIGPEDDMTHIGIYIGGGQFIDYGGGNPGAGGHARVSSFATWQKYPCHFYVPPGYVNSSEIPNSSKSTKTVKLFANSKGKTLIIDGKSEPVDVMGMYAASSSMGFTADANFLNDVPAILVKGGRGKVVSLELSIKYEEA